MQRPSLELLMMLHNWRLDTGSSPVLGSSRKARSSACQACLEKEQETQWSTQSTVHRTQDKAQNTVSRLNPRRSPLTHFAVADQRNGYTETSLHTT